MYFDSTIFGNRYQVGFFFLNSSNNGVFSTSNLENIHNFMFAAAAAAAALFDSCSQLFIFLTFCQSTGMPVI